MSKTKRPEIVEYRDADGCRILGYWVGEPEKSAFVQTGTAQDKRGVSDRLKRRVRSEAQAQDALREALQHPMPATRPAKPSAAPPPAWGTLEWYRNELAIAQQRNCMLEAEVAQLLREKREADPVLLHVIEQPARSGKLNRGPRTSRYQAEHSLWLKTGALEFLMGHPQTATEIGQYKRKCAKRIKDQTGTAASLRHLQNWVEANWDALLRMAAQMRRKLTEKEERRTYAGRAS